MNNPHNLELPENFDQNDSEFFLPHFEYKLLEPQLITLNHVFYFQNGVLTNSAGKKIKLHLPWLDWGVHLNRRFWLKRIIKYILKGEIQWISGNMKSWVIGVNPFGDNYFHWITEVLPKLLFLKDKLKEPILMLPADCTKEYQIETLKLLQLPFKYIKKKSGFFSKAYICSPFAAFSGYSHKESIHKVKKLVENKLKDSNNRKRRIYLSRKLEKRRKVANEEELYSILNKYGFEIIYPEQLSFWESIFLYRESSVLISIHGAALTNMIFLPEGSFIFELHLERVVTDKCYYILANQLNLKYYYQNCKAANESSDHINADILVDPVEFGKNIKSLLGDKC